jgi:hypothetical protein
MGADTTGESSSTFSSSKGVTKLSSSAMCHEPSRNTPARSNYLRGVHPNSVRPHSKFPTTLDNSEKSRHRIPPLLHESSLFDKFRPDAEPVATPSDSRDALAKHWIEDIGTPQDLRKGGTTTLDNV